MKCLRMMFACLAAGMSLVVMGNPISLEPVTLQAVEVKSTAVDQYAKEMQQAIAAINLADEKLLKDEKLRNPLFPIEKSVYLCIPIPPSDKEHKKNAQPKIAVQRIDLSGIHSIMERMPPELPHEFTIDGQKVFVSLWFDYSVLQYRHNLSELPWPKDGYVLHAIGVNVAQPKSRGFLGFLGL